MPRQSISYTNRARYMAVIGSEKSMPLKLHRRMRFSTIEHKGRKVILRGRVFRAVFAPTTTEENLMDARLDFFGQCTPSSGECDNRRSSHGTHGNHGAP